MSYDLNQICLCYQHQAKRLSGMDSCLQARSKGKATYFHLGAQTSLGPVPTQLQIPHRASLIHLHSWLSYGCCLSFVKRLKNQSHWEAWLQQKDGTVTQTCHCQVSSVDGLCPVIGQPCWTFLVPGPQLPDTKLGVKTVQYCDRVVCWLVWMYY